MKIFPHSLNPGFVKIKIKTFLAVFSLAVLILPMAALGQGSFFDRYGAAAGYGANIHPKETQVKMAFVLPYVSHDFGKYWRGNLEAFIGKTLEPENRWAVGLTPMLQYGLSGYDLPNWFVEGGIGLFYTEVNVPGFGSPRVFSPQAGFGRMFQLDSKRALTLRLRYHHLSNAYLSKENTSIDSILLMLGMDFGN